MCGARHTVPPWTTSLPAEGLSHSTGSTIVHRPDAPRTLPKVLGSEAWQSIKPIQSEPLIEFGAPVTISFRNGSVQAFRDCNSGYVYFDPPPSDELNDYYQYEYPQIGAQAGYYLIEADYEVYKNEHMARRLLRIYDSFFSSAPRTSLELGCAYGGLVAELARHGVAARGSDINEGAIREGKDIKGNHNIFHADNLDTLSQMTGRVDLIYSLGSLEHDPNMFRVIAACRERLTNNGLLFIMLPNAMFAGSVFGGFKNNWWVNYPQHLHMPSPGFIPYLCRELGFLPLYWDTRILFEPQAQPPVSSLFAEMTNVHRELWDLLLLRSGLGMELNVALTPDMQTRPMQFAATVQAINSTLEQARQQEIRIRQYLKGAPPSEDAITTIAPKH